MAQTRYEVPGRTWFPTEGPSAASVFDPAATGPGPAPQARLASPAARKFLNQLLDIQLITALEADHFLERNSDQLADMNGPAELGAAMMHAGLITRYQVDRLLTGCSHGLVLGNYRVVDRLGSGSMGVVFLAEHALLKRRVAVKVLPVNEDCPASMLERFFSEMRVLADLHHPNIVMAYDAGQLPAAGPNMPPLLYLVMELIDGGDLEGHVSKHGTASIPQGCDWICQAALGLQEAHDHHLIHRDIKPSNLLLSRDGQVKLVDFGLVRQFSSRLTEPRALLGTIEFMAPEQSFDASAIDGRADIYGLGATLFGILTGEPPYPTYRSVSEMLHALQNKRPRLLRELRPDAPEELERVIDGLLSKDPAARPALPFAVMKALLPFSTRREVPYLIKSCAGHHQLRRESSHEDPATTPQQVGKAAPTTAAQPHRLLIIDDEAPFRQLARTVLEPRGYVCVDARDGTEALAALDRTAFDVVLLDLNLPDIDGLEICRRIRQDGRTGNVKIIVVSGRGDKNQLAEALPHGADDYIVKPFGLREFEARVGAAIRLKDAQDQADQLCLRLLEANSQMEDSLQSQNRHARESRNALLFALANMAESRCGESAGHLHRMQGYVRRLGEEAASQPGWVGVINSAFLDQLERCVPLHDLGKLALPEAVLLKEGALTEAERRLVETHTIMGERLLETIGEEAGNRLSFLGMASAVVRHHHERYDGTGYPDRLRGEQIPHAARLTALADVYDTLRSVRAYKNAVSHAEAVDTILDRSPGQFDPALLRAFVSCAAEFDRISCNVRT